MLSHDVHQFSINNLDPTFHVDTIHHVEFDFYGQRVVTVSSDKMVCIWDRDAQGNWRKSASWKKHGGAVWKARFAYPGYGQVLATCSFDNAIQIFDKDAAETLDSRSVGSADTSNGWVCRAVLRQSTASITDIQFAPHYLGLQLAACTSSGRVIIYEAEDIMALDNWNVLFDDVLSPHRLSSLSWSTNRFDPPFIAVSSDDVDASPDEKLYIFRVNVNSRFIRSQLHFGNNSRREEFHQFKDQVSMVSFGPSCGLAAHKLAVAVGVKIFVYQLMSAAGDNNNGEGENNNNNGGASSSALLLGENGRTAQQQLEQQQSDFVVKECDVLEEGNSQVVRLSWNVLGDVISAVYADGIVRIWRCGFSLDQ